LTFSVFCYIIAKLKYGEDINVLYESLTKRSGFR